MNVSGSTFTGQLTQAIDLKDSSKATFTSNTIDNNGTSAIEQVLIANTAVAGFTTNTFKNTKYTAFQVKNTAKLLSTNDIFDGTTLPTKYIKDSTAEVSLINTSGTSSSTIGGVLDVSCVNYDFNKDKAIDIMDFATWRPCYTKKGDAIATSGCSYADINSDKSVDIMDFASFVVALTNYRTTTNKACVK